MMHSWKRILVTPILAGFFLSQVTWALAGTTGKLFGTIVDASTSAPVAGVSVTVTSPSATQSTQTDATGHFAFLSLTPDTYSVSATKESYAEQSQPGVTVFADATQVVSLRLEKSLKTIARVTSRAAGSLVKPGTTADVYSVNATTQDKVSGVGGGGGLNNAYSAIATIPGAYVPMNQNGYFQTVHVRGGDYDQLGYEVDGVPVNRSFDNYPGGTASSFGQQELQVYTGASPANSEGQGLAGYINQVIKVGTFPGYAETNLGLGGPSYYHKASVAAGGASPDRLFSYYVGVGGFNSDNFLYVDRNQAPQYTFNWGNVIDQDASGNFQMSPINTFSASGIASRDVVANFHFGLPHKKDSGRDDVQLLYSNQFLKTTFYDSTNDVGQALYATSTVLTPAYYDGLLYTGGLGQVLAQGSDITGAQQTYYFPSSSSPARCANVPTGFANACPVGTTALIDPNARDTIYNDQGIVKLQYQKNFGATAYLRVYGYTFYSDWLQTGPQSAWANYFGPSGPDYRLNTHTYGASASYVRQFSPAHLVTAQASYTSANSLRDNNRTFYDLFGFGGAQTDLAVLVSSAHPMNGLCYSPTGVAQSCDPKAHGNASFVHFGDTSVPTVASLCDGAPCEYLTVEDGHAGLYNKVKPEFTSLSLTDEYRVNDRLLLNLGLRSDRFKFIGADTTGPTRAFWFNAYNIDKCVDPTTGAPIDKNALGFTPTTPCGSIPLASGTGTYANANLINASGQVLTYSVFQPRFATTYTVNPDTVLRASVGRYAEPPNTAYEQYSAQQQDIADLLGSRFYKYGFNTPGHQVYPPTSFNADLSLEKRIHNTDWTLKLTPFYRHTQNQIQNFFLDQRTGFVSGLNVGSLTAKGVEFQINKGDFTRDGLSGFLSFTYTNAKIKYSTLSNGTTILSQTNQDIKNYNAYTSFCASNPNDAHCTGGAVSTSGSAAAPCYSTTGTPIPSSALCVAGTVANPYWNAPVQALIDPGQEFEPYDIFPGGIGSSADSYNVPYTATLVLNYKRQRFSITPSLQYAAGNRYGAPETVPGIAPETCTGVLGAVSGDPRYPYGGSGSSFDSGTCGTLNAIPDPYTGHFDLPGEFRNPAQLAMNLQLGYDVSPRVKLTATLANIVNTCWGGTGPGTAALNNKDVCSWGILGSAAGGIPPFGNAYNPGSAAYTSAPAFLKYPYEPSFGPVNVDGTSTKQPFQFYVEARIKL